MAKKKTASKHEPTPPDPDGALSVPSDYPQLLAAVKERIQAGRIQAHLAANRELVELYWDLGKLIVERQDSQGWGKSVVERLSGDLCAEFPEMKGLSLSNLWRMRSFYLAHNQDLAILAQAVRELETSEGSENLARPVRDSSPVSVLAQPAREILRQAVAELERSRCPAPLLAIPWGHNISLIEKLKDPALRLWYAAQAAEHGWSRAVLVHQIESELHLRATSQDNNFAATLPDAQSDLARELIKDSFNLEFLDVRDSIRERELEESLIANLRDFLLELGTGFAFIGNQYRLDIAGQDYFLDLLFYHTHLHCHVVVELKIDAFKPEYAGKIHPVRYGPATIPLRLRSPQRERRPILHRLYKRSQTKNGRAPRRLCPINKVSASRHSSLLRGMPLPIRRHQTRKVSKECLGKALHQGTARELSHGVKFYLAAVDDLLKSERDAPTIGILLCKEKNQIVVEYALRDASKPIAVADYTLKKTLPKELKGKLPSASELKKRLREGGDS